MEKIVSSSPTRFLPINWGLALAAGVAGIVGTIAFDLVAWAFTGTWSVPEMLAEATGLGLFGGVLHHYGNGIALAIIFAGIAPLLWGPIVARAVLFMIIQTIVGVGLFMMPLMGMGIMASESEAPLRMNVEGMIQHIAFGIVLGVLYPVIAQMSDSPVAED